MSSGIESAVYNQFFDAVNTVEMGFYEKLAITTGEQLHRIHYRRICTEASNGLVTAITGLISAEVDEAHLTEYTGEGDQWERPHRYIMSVEDSDIIADPTWQQFLAPKQRNPELPRIITGRRAAVIDRIRACGVSREAVLQLWEPANSRN